mmetsp:Transcript_23287/g.41398  ORF Transcript_23287/g.41398 Transcript_23287/m.41398 type:complete len:116 (+) Transcript_23287:331-678(+)
MTGGNQIRTTTKTVISIDTIKDFAVLALPPIITSRSGHGACNFSLSLCNRGNDQRTLRECERYQIEARSREVIPPLLVGAECASVIALKSTNKLHALGGFNSGELDCVQMLDTES